MVLHQSKKTRDILSAEKLLRIEANEPRRYVFLSKIFKKWTSDRAIWKSAWVMHSVALLFLVLFYVGIIAVIPANKIMKLLLVIIFMLFFIGMFTVVAFTSYFRNRSYPLIITAKGIVKEPLFNAHWEDIDGFGWYRDKVTGKNSSSLSIYLKSFLHRDYFANSHGRAYFRNHNIFLSDEQVAEAEKIFLTYGVPSQGSDW